MAVAMIPGIATGKTTVKKARIRVAPSTIAACSNSIGIVSKKAASSQSAYGRAKVVYAKVRPVYVFVRCTFNHHNQNGNR